MTALGSDRAKMLTRLLTRLREKYEPIATPTSPVDGPCACHNDPVLRELIRSMLLAGATSAKAEAALRKIDSACVDINEFRVCTYEEMTRIIGPGYPGAQDRCERMRSALGELYKREHKLALAHLRDKPKREARAYLESLTGASGFAAARVALVQLGAHAVPVDARLLELLVAAKVVDPEMTPESAGAWLERTIPAGEALAAHALLQAWSDDGAGVRLESSKPKPERRAKVGAKKATGERVARKKKA